MTGKRDLLFVGNVLVAEDEHHHRRYRAETDDGLGVRGIRFNLVQDGATTPEIIEPLSKQVNDSHSSRFIIKLDDSIWTLTTSRISRPDIGCETRRLANPRVSTHRDRPARAFSKLIFFREVDHSSPEGPRVSSQQISTGPTSFTRLPAKAASPLPEYGRTKGAERSAPAAQGEPALPELADLLPNACDRLARGLGHQPAVGKLEAALIVWFIAPIPDLSRGMCAHKRAPGLDRPEARLQLGVKQMPDVNHFWPDL
jgi:hypothetical protein